MSNTKNIKTLISKFITMTELEFTKKVVIPFLELHSFIIIDYHGGAYEEGKDLICYKRDEFGDLDVCVVQIKKFKFSAKAKSKSSFSEVVTQLSQAFESKVPYIDGKKYSPSRVLFITPYEIDTRALSSRFEKYSSLVDMRLKTFDGYKIAELISEKSKTLMKDIIGTELVFNFTNQELLMNSEIVSALDSPNSKEVSRIYTDLDFGIGKNNIHVFFNCKFSGKKKRFNMNEPEWNRLKNICKEYHMRYGENIIDKSIDEVEEDYKSQAKVIEENSLLIARNRKMIKDLIESIGLSINTVKDKIKEINDNVTIRDVQRYKSIFVDLENLNNDLSDFYTCSLDEDFNKFNIKISNTVNRLCECLNLPRNYFLIDAIIESVNTLALSRRTVDKLERLSQHKPISVSVDGLKISNKLNEIKKYFASKIEYFNFEKYSQVALKEFLNKCNDIFFMVDLLLSYSKIRNLVCNTVQCRNRGEINAKLCLPISNIFETGLDLLILGEAGAGKTTSLQYYCSYLSKYEDKKPHIYLPLSKVFSYSQSYIECLDSFVNMICIFLNKSGYHVEAKEIDYFLDCNSCTVMFDGIDEIIKKCPEFINIILDFKEKYVKSQVIATTRASSHYIDNIPFLSLCLLPFTDDQRKSFVNNWFKEDINKSTEICEHLCKNNDISEIVRSPLAATILCVLAENNLPLPNSEYRLYQERQRLLLGHYDIHKQVRRLKNSWQDLELVAQKIAYFLHKEELRQSMPNVILNNLYISLKGKINRSTIESIFNELIDPANLIVPMTVDGKVGFGHLRYQEYLAACELRNNRSIGVAQYLDQPWWKGALVLFSQLTDNIHFLINIIAKRRHIYSNIAIETFKEMVSVRPLSEQKELRKLINDEVFERNALSDFDISLNYEDLIEEFDYN